MEEWRESCRGNGSIRKNLPLSIIFVNDKFQTSLLTLISSYFDVTTIVIGPTYVSHSWLFLNCSMLPLFVGLEDHLQGEKDIPLSTLESTFITFSLAVDIVCSLHTILR